MRPLSHAPTRDFTARAASGPPRLILRAEGAALLVLATAGFALTGISWWLYALLFFAPDLAMAAYAAGPRLGALAYNTAHTSVLPALLAGVGAIAETPLALAVAAVWAAHIGFDRMLGYGLKYDTGFHDTHLGRIGRAKAAA